MKLESTPLFPWLRGAWSQWLPELAQGRIPHAVLIESPIGLGATQLAARLCAALLCDRPDARGACLDCASCRLMLAGNHPDWHDLQREEDAKQLKVEQVRRLIDDLTLKSFRGGYKAALITEAQLLNASGANALLKTLEEPTPATVLVLIATPLHCLPATIASRCRRLRLPVPPREAALAWLTEQSAEGDWSVALALANGTPLAAYELGAQAAAQLHREMLEDVRDLGADRADVSVVADRWIKSKTELRLSWLENWVTSRIRQGFTSRVADGEFGELVGLRPSLLKAKIRSLFEFRDALHTLKRLETTSISPLLAFESLLFGARTAFGDGALKIGKR